MATSLDYIEFTCGQVGGTGAVRYKKKTELVPNGASLRKRPLLYD